MIQKVVSSIWLSFMSVLTVLIFCTISLMVTQTESSSDYTPLVRPRSEHTSSNGNESTLSDADVEKRIQEVFSRKGYSNPDPSPNDSQEAQPDVKPVKTGSHLSSRRKMWKIDENFDPRKSYVIKHPNGTITYVPPRDLDLSAKVSTGTTTKPSSTVTSVLIDKMSEASFPFTQGVECTSENPICSNDSDYSEQLINQIMDRQKGRFAEVFGNDVVIPNGDSLAQRFGDEDGGQFICDSEETVNYPRIGFNMAEKSVQIVNTDEYRQGVRIETCRNQHKPCEKIAPLFVKTECRQFFHYRTILAIHPETKEPYKELIKLPSCCKCVILQ